MPVPSAKFRLSINLLHPQGLAENIAVKFLRWLLKYGRFIVVVVEIMVLTTFVARFKLDADLADLKEDINAQVPFIESLSNIELLVKNVQFQVQTFTKIKNQTANYPEILTKIASQTPQGVKLQTININRQQENEPLQLRVTGLSLSNNDLSSFITGLASEPSFQNIALANIALEKGGVNFTITGQIR